MLFIGTPLFAWGPEGHRVVAQIARAHLSQRARHQIENLLGNDDLASVSTWADEIRPQRPETFGWHFVDIPMNSSGFDEQRDCYRPNEKNDRGNDHHNCVVDRIVIFEQVLGDKRASKTDRVEALKFLVHFVGAFINPCTPSAKPAAEMIFTSRSSAQQSAALVHAIFIPPGTLASLSTRPAPTNNTPPILSN